MQEDVGCQQRKGQRHAEPPDAAIGDDGKIISRHTPTLPDQGRNGDCSKGDNDDPARPYEVVHLRQDRLKQVGQNDTREQRCQHHPPGRSHQENGGSHPGLCRQARPARHLQDAHP